MRSMWSVQPERRRSIGVRPLHYVGHYTHLGGTVRSQIVVIHMVSLQLN